MMAAVQKALSSLENLKRDSSWLYQAQDPQDPLVHPLAADWGVRT